jgi:hypothetical protein
MKWNWSRIKNGTGIEFNDLMSDCITAPTNELKNIPSLSRFPFISSKETAMITVPIRILVREVLFTKLGYQPTGRLPSHSLSFPLKSEIYLSR